MTASTRIVSFASVLALLACTPTISGAEPKRASRSPSAAPSAAADLDWRGTIARGGALRISNVQGDVKVTRAAGRKARIRGYKSGPDADDVKIVVEEDGDRVSVRPDYPERRSTNASVKFVIEIPAGVGLDAEVVSGDVHVEGVWGALALESVDGDIDASGSSDVAVETVNGNVVVRLPKTANRARLEAVNGALEVRLPKTLGASVRAATLSGTIDSDFPLRRKQDFVGANAEVELGNGKASISLETVNGRIGIKKS